MCSFGNSNELNYESIIKLYHINSVQINPYTYTLMLTTNCYVYFHPHFIEL